MTDHRTIERIAAEWIARRSNPDGSWSQGDQASLNRWLDESVAHKVAYLRLDVAWERANTLHTLRPNGNGCEVPLPGAWQQSPYFARRLTAKPETPQTGASKLGSLRFRPRRDHSPPKRWPALAASLLVAVGLAAGAGSWYATGSQHQRFQTAMGAIHKEAMLDGSSATLSSDSQVAVSLTRGRRDIELVRGEAYFQVAKDPGRPFVVNAGGTTVTAVGTQFSVRRSEEAMRLVVTEGTVRLDPSMAGNKMPSATLTAGAIAVVTKQGVRVESRSPEQATEAIGWISGDVVFHGTPLREAVVEFNRFNHMQLVIMDPRAGEIHVDGNFKVGNAVGFSRLISQVFPVEVMQKQDRAEIYLRE